MKALTVSRSIPRGYQCSYSRLLYNRTSFLEVNNSLPQVHFYLLNKDTKQVLGHIAFSREENEVVSPYKAPYGGFELVNDLESSSFLFFLYELLRMLKEDSIRFLRIHLPPAHCLPNVAMVKENLKTLAFREKQNLKHHMLTVSEAKFGQKIATMEQRKLKKARTLGCEFRVARRDEYAGVYAFLKQHRESKGHQLSMSWDMLREALKDHNAHYLFCTVNLEDQMIAAAIMVHVNDEVLYYFIPGHDAEYNHLSPMVFLISELYQWCQQQGIQYIDLGTSYWAGEENESLVKFKERMGGQVSSSSVFRKALSS